MSSKMFISPITENQLKVVHKECREKTIKQLRKAAFLFSLGWKIIKCLFLEKICTVFCR